jgi:hypothetical protein
MSTYAEIAARGALGRERIEYCFDSVGHIIAAGVDGAYHFVISFPDPQVSGDIMFEVFSHGRDTVRCRNLDDLIIELKRPL